MVFVEGYYQRMQERVQVPGLDMEVAVGSTQAVVVVLYSIHSEHICLFGEG